MAELDDHLLKRTRIDQQDAAFNAWLERTGRSLDATAWDDFWETPEGRQFL